MSDRISEDEYMAALGRLEREMANAVAAGRPVEVAAAAFERGDFDLAVDFRLGRQVTAGQREALWQARSAMAARRERLAARLAAGELPPAAFAREMQGLVDRLAEDFGQVITPAQVKAFFGEGRVPLDPSRIGET